MLWVMVSRYEFPGRDQWFVTSYRELLGDDDAVWTMIEVVEGLDLSVVYDRYGPASGAGRPAFDPTMMMTLLLFGYLEGKRSSRELEAACRRDLAYQAICGGIRPDHATIARFRVLVDDVVESVFVQVIAECDRRGMIDLERLAIDGTKMEAAASKESNHTAVFLDELHSRVRELLAETKESDCDSGSDTGGASSGSGPGGGGWSPTRRQGETLRKLDRVEQTQVEVDAARQRRDVDFKRRGRRRTGEATANVVDPESRLQKTRDGWIQGYNAQAVVTGNQIVVAAQVTAETTDVGMFQPMINQAIENLETAGAGSPVGVILADAGYWSAANFEFGDHIDAELLIATKKRSQIGVVDEIDPATASHKARARHAMETRLANNKDEYRQRGWLIEGTFAHTKTHRQIRRFQRRGLKACNAEWFLTLIAYNIGKIHRYQQHHQRGPGNPTRSDTSRTRHPRQHPYHQRHHRSPLFNRHPHR